MAGHPTLQTFVAVLAALLVFGAVVLVVQSVRGPSEAECYQQLVTDSLLRDGGLPGRDVDEDC